MPYSGPINNPPLSGESPIWSFGYNPSLAMGIVGCVSFLVVSLPHLWWFVSKRGTRSVHGVFFFACTIEALGYGARLYLHNHEFSGMAFLFSIFLVQTATILVTAPLYKSIQRGLKYMPEGESLSPMRIRSLLTVFICLDVLWVFIQVGGQFFWASAQAADILTAVPMFALGTSTVVFLAGNVLQAIAIITVSAFCIVILKRSERVLAVVSPETTVPHLKPLIAQILISFGLFFVRLIFRIAVGAQGAYESAATHEVYFGVFEYLPIILIIILWAVRPLYKFIFPFGHPRHNAAGHVQEAAIASSVNGSNTTEHGTKA